VQVNMLDAKSQLSRLVKAALAGEEVIIASHGKPRVKLAPCAAAAGLKQPGGLATLALNRAQLDEAFSETTDQHRQRSPGECLVARARVMGSVPPPDQQRAAQTTCTGCVNYAFRTACTAPRIVRA